VPPFMYQMQYIWSVLRWEGRSWSALPRGREEGIPMREVAEAIGSGLGLPVNSVTSDEAADYFGPLAQLAALDLAASGEFTAPKTRMDSQRPGLLTDLHNMGHEKNSTSDRL